MLRETRDDESLTGWEGHVNGLVAGLLTSFPVITNCGVGMRFIIARFQRRGGCGVAWRD